MRRSAAATAADPHGGPGERQRRRDRHAQSRGRRPETRRSRHASRPRRRARGTPTGRVRFADATAARSATRRTSTTAAPSFAGWPQGRPATGSPPATSATSTSWGTRRSRRPTVNKADTATTLTGSAAKVAPGQSVVLTAMVARQAARVTSPTFGSLQFTANGIADRQPVPARRRQGVRVTSPPRSVPGHVHDRRRLRRRRQHERQHGSLAADHGRRRRRRRVDGPHSSRRSARR